MSNAPIDASREHLRVLYLGGMGRSGSTLLERAVAQLPGVCGAGELVWLWDRGIRKNERCGCGEPFSGCPFWNEVGALAFGGWENVDVDRVEILRSRVDDVKFVPRLFLPTRLGGLRLQLEEYLSYYEPLYAAIRQVSGCEVVVDSSKLTSLVYILSHSSMLDLRLVHLLRDPRAVAYAWTKVVRRPEVVTSCAYMPRYSPGYMALLFVGHHGLLEFLRLRRVPSLQMRYEDFAENPLLSIRAVAEFAGVPYDEGKLRGDGNRSLRLERVHTVSGNPSRFQTGEIAVRVDEKWRQEMPRGQRRLVGAITLPARLRYGYLRTKDATPNAATEFPAPSEWPSVTVLVPTHDRPMLMRRAVASIIGQDYPGDIDVLVVYDKSEPDETLISHRVGRLVGVHVNDRTPGLAGARNTGILASGGDLVAFCDDDDRWEPAKLTRQVSALLAEQESEFATTAMVIDYQDRSIVRLAGKDRVYHRELVRSRLAMLHSSSFLARRKALVTGIGLIDETMPRSMAEDWDILLRAARRRPIVHVDEPLVRVQWGPTSYFADQWQTRNEAHIWMLEHHPEIGHDPIGAGLAHGKIAFGHAMLGHPRESLNAARTTLRANPREPRAYLAILVACRLLSGQWIVDQLNKRGHGI